MIGKIHMTEDRKIFACCDKELLGKKLRFKGVDVLINSSFYGKDKITKESLIKNIKDCDSANIFGNRACKILLDSKLITKEQIIYIQNIAHIQLYKL